MRGCEKRVIHIRNTDSRIFEEAYVVLKPGAAERCRVENEGDMIKEARRLVEESLNRVYPAGAKKQKRRFLLPFFIGVSAVSLLFTLITLFLLLL